MRVLMIADPAQTVEQELLDAVRKRMSVDHGATIDLRVAPLGEFIADESIDPNKSRADLVVAVGAQATYHLAVRQLAAPVLSVLTPRTSFDAIARDWRYRNGSSAESKLSAIYLDQSPQRHFALIRLLFPEAQRVALLLGPATAGYADEMRAAARANGLTALVEKVAGGENLVVVLDHLLPRADVMLAMVDPLVFNRTNAQSVLLTAYRHRTPLIGVSPAYVRAGAIAAVHTTPAQVGTQLAELLIAFARQPTRRLPAPQYPQPLSVAINEHVARSLAISLPDRERIEAQLKTSRGAP